MGKLSDKELLERIMADTDFEKDVAKIISAQINEELGKKKPDYNKIAELSEQYSYIVSADEEIESRSEQHIQQILSTARQEKTKFSIRMKVFSALTACAVIAFGLNIYSFNAWGMNMIDAIYTMQKGGMSIDIHNINDFGRKTIELPTSHDDPYGIKAKCAEYGVYPETPTYIPDGFELKHFEEYEYDTHKTIRFFYRKNGYIWLNITYMEYIDYESIPPVGIPTDTYTVHEETINGHSSWILKEDNQFTDIYIDNENIKYSFFMQSLDYDECYKIVESMCK